MSEKTVLICMRVADCDPHTESIIVGCDDCSAPLWLANSSPETDERICLKCLAARASALAETVIELEPMTQEQIKDVKKVLE
jgi:hypothetical protein